MLAYSISTIASHELADPNRRSVLRALEGLAHDRALALKELHSQPGRIGPPPAEREYGDVVILMIDPGEGDAMREEVAKLIGGR